MDKSDRIIKVYDVVGGDSAITDTDGKLVYDEVDKLLTNGLKVVLDFSNINFMITVFLNAAIGQLYKKYTSEQLNRDLKMVHLSDYDHKHMQDVIDYAKKFFNEPEREKEANDAITKVLGA
jgi:hypothetical protein